MATREAEVAALLRADATLVALLPGGVYESATLPEAGITSPTTTPGVYVNGLLIPTAIVRERVQVPTLQLTELKDQLASASQTVEIYVYQRGGSDIILEAGDRLYALLQGHIFSRAWPAAWTFAVGPLDSPEMPGTQMARIDFTITTIRRPVPI